MAALPERSAREPPKNCMSTGKAAEPAPAMIKVECIHPALKMKKDSLDCPICKDEGALRKNGGAALAQRAWICKDCNKQVAGQPIVSWRARSEHHGEVS